MTLILIIISLFTLSTFIALLGKKDEEYCYIYIDKDYWIFPKYSGIYFESIFSGLTLLKIQYGNDGFDRCITLCNISFILGKGDY